MMTIGWLDIVLGCIVLLHVFNGVTRGLIRQLFDLLGFFIIIIVAFYGSRLFSESLAEYINTEDILPHHDLFQSIGVDVMLERVPQLIAGLVAFLVLFLFLSIVFRLFSGGFRWINRIPVIGLFNRLGGSVLGFLVGLFFIYIIVAVLSIIPMPFFTEAMEKSEIAFLVNYYLTPIVSKLKDVAIDFYMSYNG